MSALGDNEKRSAVMGACLKIYNDIFGEPGEDRSNLVDFVADLMLFVASTDQDFDDVLTSARNHVSAESPEVPPVFVSAGLIKGGVEVPLEGNGAEDYSFLDDPAEREWLIKLEPLDVVKNAHRFYAYMSETGMSVDSFTRELAFQKASKALDLDYDVLYEAWVHEKPVTAEIREAIKPA